MIMVEKAESRTEKAGICMLADFDIMLADFH